MFDEGERDGRHRLVVSHSRNSEWVK
jgi:hypothetical protein